MHANGHTLILVIGTGKGVRLSMGNRTRRRAKYDNIQILAIFAAILSLIAAAIGVYIAFASLMTNGEVIVT